MSKGKNLVILIGNVGGDVEVKYLGDGTAVANLTLATSETWKDKTTKQPKESVEWHKLVFFGRLAEIVGQYVTKGSKIYAEGKLQTRSWEQDGVKRYTTEIKCHEMQMLDSRGNQPEGGQKSAQKQSQAPQQQSAANSFDDFEDDIPF